MPIIEFLAEIVGDNGANFDAFVGGVIGIVGWDFRTELHAQLRVIVGIEAIGTAR